MEKHQTIKVTIDQPPTERLVIVDGNHLIHRAFYAIRSALTDASGNPTNAIYGFASMLLNILDREKPDFLVMTFDEKGPTFRHEAHEGYKATRTKAPDELYAQVAPIREMVTQARIPIFSGEGFEADDFMGTLAVRAASEGIDSIIVTGDMDALQLINDRTVVSFPHKGYREPTIYDDEKVFEKYGIYPNQVVDYKALMGDNSDNIKGVEGIGPKRASDLLKAYKTLDGIYENLHNVASENIRLKLASGKEDAYFSQKLARIVTDVPCNFNKDQAMVSDIDFVAWERFFESVNMQSLIRRMKRMIPEELRASKEQMSLF